MGINDSLVEDILIDILARLPSKMAIRSRSVCKVWNSIISSPEFPKRLISLQVNEKGRQEEELNVNEVTSEQFIITRKLVDVDLSLDYLPCFQAEHGYVVVSSCNGLLLCSDRHSDVSTLYICNPVTKQWASIPPAPALTDEDCIGSTALGFVCDPSYDINDQGGVVYNPHCRFRVVRAFGSSLPCDDEFDVDCFSSETGEWSKSWFARSKMYTDGVGHYNPQGVIIYKNKLCFQVAQNLFVYDPYSNRTCGDIDPPMEATLDGFSWCQGFLWAYQLRHKSSTLYMWKLIEGGNGNNQDEQRWDLERKVVLSKPLRFTLLGGKCMKYGRVLTIHPDNPNLVYIAVSFIGEVTNPRGFVVLWNLEKGTLERISEYDSHRFLTWGDAFFLELPLWPYSIPSFPTTS